MKRRFVALTTVIEVEIDDHLETADLAALLISGYPDTDAPPLLRYHLRGGADPGVSCVDRYDDHVSDVSDIVPMFELDLYQEVAWRAAPGWLLHAAALECEDRTLVFAGPSGAGKTTLTLALLDRGWRLLTEEMVLVDRELHVTGLARPIHAPREQALPSTWQRLPYPVRTASELHFTSIAQPPAAIRQPEPRPLHALVRIHHGPTEPAVTETLPPARAIERLWDCTLRKDADGISAATAVAGQARLRELRSASVEDAVRQAIEIMKAS